MVAHILNIAVGLTFSGGVLDLFLFGILQGNEKTSWMLIIPAGIIYLDVYKRQVYCRPNTANSPDSGTTSGSRQTLITGEAAKRACEKLMEDLKDSSLEELEGRDYVGEYLAKTDKMGSDVPNPVSHVAYGYATQVCVLNEDGTIKKVVAAHDVGKAVNPISVEGQMCIRDRIWRSRY